jgi:protein-S-isoprenylcysteine O-methyltransferase Ste14
MNDLQGVLLAIVIWAYWSYVGALAVRVRRRTRKLAGIVPSQALEQAMWLLWVPLVLAWMLLPWLASQRGEGPWALPAFARESPYAALRWAGVALALLCLALSVTCWRRMGKSWRMSVTPGDKTELITTGPYAYVRHPIYALSILLMLCTLLVVPTGPVLLMAAVHITLMLVKARNEERFLAGVHGPAYERYCRQTGRFLPRLGGHAAGASPR